MLFTAPSGRIWALKFKDVAEMSLFLLVAKISEQISPQLWHVSFDA